MSSKRIQRSSGRETINGKEWTYWKVADRGNEDGQYDCDRILMNDVAHVVRWSGNPDVSRLAGEPIRLKIAMSAAKLHAFQFVSE